MKLYVASSWRNPYQEAAVADLRDRGHEVYDFRNPAPGNNGFGWRQVDPNWKTWTTRQYRQGLTSDVAAAGFRFDFDGMKWADGCVCVLPCGRSAHLEAGWFLGQGKRVDFLIPPNAEGIEPELMYLLAGDPLSHIHPSMEELLKALGTPWHPERRPR